MIKLIYLKFNVFGVYYLINLNVWKKFFWKSLISIWWFLATERSLSLEEFLQRLLEQPVGQHYHSVSINKHQLIERYEEAVRDLIHRHPSFISHTNEQQPPIRTNRTSSLTASIQIPVVIHQQQQQQQRSVYQYRPDPRGSSPMQQGDDEQGSLPPPSSS
jgi:hypothetical protein